MEINRISGKGPVPIEAGSDVGAVSPSQKTAAKVTQIRLPVHLQKGGLRDKNVTLLQQAKDLSKAIKKEWNELEPEALAEQIIALEDKVSLLKESSPEVEKIRKQAEHLHFQFVFPVVLEMDASPSGGYMPLSFARSVHTTANEILKKNSTAPFKELSSTQQREVLRFATRGGAK